MASSFLGEKSPSCRPDSNAATVTAEELIQQLVKAVGRRVLHSERNEK
jgi:hypothetical protein